MKIKIFSGENLDLIEDNINRFCIGKDIVDIKMHHYGCVYIFMIIYKAHSINDEILWELQNIRVILQSRIIPDINEREIGTRKILKTITSQSQLEDLRKSLCTHQQYHQR